MTNSGDIEPKDHSKYRLIGNSVLSYRFIVPHDAVVYVGDIKKITDEIKLECAIAIASLIKDEDLSPTNILPNALDPRVVKIIVNRLMEFYTKLRFKIQP